MKNNDLEIDISKEAYDNLLKLLKENNYPCIRLSYIKSCCARVMVDLILDQIKEQDLKYKYKSITLVYDNNFYNNIKKLELIYKDNTFLIKVIPKAKNCSKNSCFKNKNCSNCNNTGSGCGNCGVH